MSFVTRRLSEAPDVTAPDGSEVRILAALAGGSMAHFTLQPGAMSIAVAHRTVGELWFIVSGRGRMWRKTDTQEEVTDLQAGISLSIPRGTAFQFRCDGDEPLCAVGVTMPPWPGMNEAYEVQGKW